MSIPDTPDARLARAALSLEGLSVGDAFGERFFSWSVEEMAPKRVAPPGPWLYTDDTEMALSLVSVLRQTGEMDQDRLARSFSEHYDPQRGYGPAMHDIVPMMWLPGSWVSLSRRLFGGQGSFGNGAAMRVAPLGAYFADDLETAASQAFDSAIVTHAHPEAAAGAVAVAVGAALAWQWRDVRPRPTLPDFLGGILTLVPESHVRTGIERARDLPPGTGVSQAARILGNGDGVSAQDTVPFVLWCAGQHLGSYEDALWLTVSGLGDRDTTCAMVGGIVALSAGAASIPDAWIAAREPLPTWPFEEQTSL